MSTLNRPRDTPGADPDHTEASPLLGSKPEPVVPRTWYWPWAPSYVAVIPVIFLAGVSVGPAIALTSPLVKVLFCERGIPRGFPISPSKQDPSDGERCDSAEYSAAIAKFIGIHATIAALMVTLTVRYWSSLSDRIGRKKVMLIGAIGSFFAQLIPLGIYYNKDSSIYWMWVSAALEGLIGSILALIALTHAYAADLSRPDERTVVFGRIIAGWYAGLGLGSALGGLVVRQYGLIAAYWLMPVLFLVNIAYLLLIPESLTVAALQKAQTEVLTSSQSQTTLISVDQQRGASEENETSRSKLSARPSRFQDAVLSLFPETLPGRLGGGKYSVVLLMLTCFLALMAAMGASYQLSNYLIYRFHWSNEKLSVLGSLQGFSRLITLTLILPLIKKLGRGVTEPQASILFDLKMVIMGLTIEGITMIIFGLSSVDQGFYLGACTGAFGSLFFPAIRGILSQSVAPELLGKTLGSLATFESLAAVVAPMAGSWVYAATLVIHPSTIFYIATAVFGITVLLAIMILIVHGQSMSSRLQ